MADTTSGAEAAYLSRLSDITVPHFQFCVTVESELSCVCVRCINFTSFYNVSIGFWNCSDSVILCLSFYSFGHNYCLSFYGLLLL